MSGRLSVRAETWPIEGSFTISRGSRTESRVVVAEIADGDHIGRGECLPYARYDETVEGVAALIEEAIGLETQDFEKEKVPASELYCGWRELSVNKEDIDEFYKNKKLPSKYYLANEFAILKAMEGSKASALGRFDAVYRTYAHADAGSRPFEHFTDAFKRLSFFGVHQRQALVHN